MILAHTNSNNKRLMGATPIFTLMTVSLKSSWQTQCQRGAWATDQTLYLPLIATCSLKKKHPVESAPVDVFEISISQLPPTWKLAPGMFSCLPVDQLDRWCNLSADVTWTNRAATREQMWSTVWHSSSMRKYQQNNTKKTTGFLNTWLVINNATQKSFSRNVRIFSSNNQDKNKAAVVIGCLWACVYTWAECVNRHFTQW